MGMPEGFASPADLAACRTLLRGGSRTFFAASLALPAAVRESATSVYAFCRVADDAIDAGKNPAAALESLRGRLDRIYRGTPADTPVDRAFADAVVRHSIPKEIPSALLEGFAWDVERRRYPDLAALRGYAVRVAGTVGAMVALLMDVRDRDALARACDLGVAMQLTNIARDVGEDAREGRLYLPLDWLEQAGIDPQRWLESPRASQALAGVVARLLAVAEDLYVASEPGIERLPARCRPGIRAARRLYAEIGHEVARRDHDSVSRRAHVDWRSKARLLAGTLIASPVEDAAVRSELPEAVFLIDAATRLGSTRPQISRATLEERLVWVIALFERLERRERVALRAEQS